MTNNKSSKTEKNKTVQINIRVQKDLAEEFRIACETQGLSQAFVHRQLMRDFVDNKKQLKLL